MEFITLGFALTALIAGAWAVFATCAVAVVLTGVVFNICNYFIRKQRIEPERRKTVALSNLPYHIMV